MCTVPMCKSTITLNLVFYEFVMHTLAFLLLFVYILMLQSHCLESVDLRAYLERGLDQCSQ